MRGRVGGGMGAKAALLSASNPSSPGEGGRGGWCVPAREEEEGGTKKKGGRRAVGLGLRKAWRTDAPNATAPRWLVRELRRERLGGG